MPASDLSRPSAVAGALLRGALALAACASVAAALWLLTVCATILPARDPAHVPLWLGVAAGMLALAGMSGARAAGRAHGTASRLAQLVLAVAAIAFGARIAAPMIAGTAPHAEGYLLLLGALLVAHGGIAAAELAGARTAAHA